MASTVYVIQYVPNPIADERMNIGVIVIEDSGTALAEFVSNWQRAKSFGNGDIDFLKEFASEIRAVAMPGQMAFADHEELPDISSIMRSVSAWQETIQTSAPRASLLSAHDAMHNALCRYLHRQDTDQRPFLTRQQVASRVVHQVETIAHERFGDQAGHFLSKYKEIEGKIQPHKVDVAITNGRLRAVIQSLSFEGTDSQERIDAVSKAAYAFNDISVSNTGGDIALIAAVQPPLENQQSRDYDFAKRTLQRAGAKIVAPNEVADCIRPIIAQLELPSDMFDDRQ